MKHHLLQKCSFFLIKLAALQASGGAYMKLRQNGIVSFSIRLAAFQARGAAYMKLRQNGIVSLMIRPAVFLAGGQSYMKRHQLKANRRISNIEGWVRSPRRRRYNPYEPEASLRHFLIK